MDNSYGYNYGGGSVIGTILYFAVLIFGVYIMWRILIKQPLFCKFKPEIPIAL